MKSTTSCGETDALTLVTLFEIVSELLVSHSSKLGLLSWLQSFPAESKARLYQINHASTSASHIVLALGYGFYDSHIRKLNRLIIGLMLSRLKAERTGRDSVVASINITLQNLHESINSVTGHTPAVHEGACQSPAKRRALMAK